MKRFITIGSVAAMVVSGAALAQGGKDGKPPTPPTPPTAPTPAPRAPSTPATEKTDLLTTLTAAGNYKTLIVALNASGLNETLKGKGPFTLFAPTDEAFKKLPAGTVDGWLKPENKQTLANILKLHVIAGTELTTGEIAKMQETSATLAGQALQVTTKDGKSQIGNTKAMASFVKGNLHATNCVVHPIDTVLMPTTK